VAFRFRRWKRMNRSIGGAVVLVLAGVAFGQDIHFKTRTMQPAERVAKAAVSRADDPTDNTVKHRIIQFDHAPDVNELDALLQDGLQVVGALPDNAVVVAAAGGR